MSSAPVTFTLVVNEGSIAKYSCSLEDENAASVGSGVIDSLTLTLVNKADGSIINSRSDQDVLNTNNVTVSAGGALVYLLQPADTAIIDTDLSTETHVGTFKMQFNTTGFSTWDVEFVIRNLAQVT